MNQDTRTREQRSAEDIELINKLQDSIGYLFAWRYENGEVTLTAEAMREILRKVRMLTRSK